MVIGSLISYVPDPFSVPFHAVYSKLARTYLAAVHSVTWKIFSVHWSKGAIQRRIELWGFLTFLADYLV